jgi:hypothetical protein
MRTAAKSFLLLSSLASGCGQATSTCESLWDNDCNSGCRCPDDLKCRIYSDGLESRGRNACFKYCSQSSDCPESTYCVDVSVQGPSGVEVKGQCWPECKDNQCPVGTSCSDTQLHADARAIRACY